ncbi:TMEM175 family protein [Curtobacterium flaccumfaciens]|nr:TMEM175 family protein [Curtobacterium flaccumfaciens]
MTEQARTERGLDRLVNFSDATVAIAITLLVLPLVDLAGELTRGEGAGDLVREHWPSIIEFLVTFWVIARFWTLHHQVFEHVRSYNPRVMRLNFVWLLSIVFLPFAANLLDSGEDGDRVAYALYLGSMVITSLALTAIDRELRRSPELLSAPLGDWRKGPIAVGLLALALVLALVFPSVGLYWVLLLVLQGTIARLLPEPRA